MSNSPSKRRTRKQQNAIEVFCRDLAEALNDGGHTMMHVLRHDAELPWTQERVKDLLWRSIQEAMFGKTSTTDLSTEEVGMVYEALNNHIAQTKGVHVAFPEETV